MIDKVYKRATWLAAATIYEVNVRQYSHEGTFNAFAKELPRLKDMGVEVLWFMPVHPIGEKNRKGMEGSYYSVKDFKDVNPEYGTLQDFEILVKKAHELEMKVIIDWVANHAAWDNVWTKEHPEYFERDAAGNFRPPYDWTDVIQIDHSSEEEQAAMIGAMKFWIENLDIDGFRADLAHLTPLAFWKKARTEIEPLKPELFWLAETEEIAYHEVFDASYTWEWMHKTEDFSKGKIGLQELCRVLEKYDYDFPVSAYRMYFTSNHDENSWNGTEYEKYGDLAKALAVFSVTWNGIPMIYSGQELPNLKRLKFFEKDTIEWKKENTLHEFYKTLLSLKKKNLALRACDKSVQTHFVSNDKNKKILSYLRKSSSDEVFVVLNLGSEKETLQIRGSIVSGDFTDVFKKTSCRFDEEAIIQMQPYEFLVFEKNDQ